MQATYASLAEIRLACDEPKPAEAQARKALELLGDRIDHLQEVGTAQLALGRALSAQGRLDDAEAWIAVAEATFERARSAGQPAAGCGRLAARGHTTVSRHVGGGRPVDRVDSAAASCRRTSPRRGWRGDRRAPSLRQRGSAYSLGEHSRTSLRMTGLLARSTVGIHQRGIHRRRHAASTTAGRGLPGSGRASRSASRRPRRPRYVRLRVSRRRL